MSKNNKNNINDYQKIIDEGISCVNKKQYNQAKIYFEKAIKIDQSSFEAYINLSNILILINNISGATDLLINYLIKIKFNKNIANQLAKICLKFNLEKQLFYLFKILKIENSTLKRDFDFLYFVQGCYYEKINNYKNAIISYKKSIKCNELYLEYFIKILSIFETTNNIKEFKKYLNLGLKNFRNKRDLIFLLYYQSLILCKEKKFIESQKIIEKFNLIKEFKNSKDFYIRTINVEIKNYENLNNYNLAFKKVITRNLKLKNSEENKIFNKDNIIKTIEKYKQFYNKSNISYINKNLKYDDDKNLVFLVGFPRSGTTLLDTILRTHSKTIVLEEKPFLLNLRHNFFSKKGNNLNAIKNITQEEKNQIRDNYFNEINIAKNKTKKIIIDKFPLSIIELGFIKCIFPDSKIILALRHPCDVIISCFFSSFKINDAMINFLDWNNTIDFYNHIFDLYEFYQKELSLRSYEVKYENVVKNFDHEILKLLNFLNLDYEENLKKFYLTAQKRTKIFTPSYDQVINPLYSTSIGRWKNYQKFADSQKYLQKWINKFNYYS